MINIMEVFKKFIFKERSAHRLAISFCVGNFIAFSPFIAFHTIMVIASGWLFRLNTSLMLAVSYGINNPWTAIPIYTLDYVFGKWLLYSFLKVDMRAYNPAWVTALEQWCSTYLGIKDLCFWSFIIGGNVLGIIISVLLYPVIYAIFRKLAAERHGATLS